MFLVLQLHWWDKNFPLSDFSFMYYCHNEIAWGVRGWKQEKLENIFFSEIQRSSFLLLQPELDSCINSSLEITKGNTWCFQHLLLFAFRSQFILLREEWNVTTLTYPEISTIRWFLYGMSKKQGWLSAPETKPSAIPSLGFCEWNQEWSGMCGFISVRLWPQQEWLKWLDMLVTAWLWSYIEVLNSAC